MFNRREWAIHKWPEARWCLHNNSRWCRKTFILASKASIASYPEQVQATKLRSSPRMQAVQSSNRIKGHRMGMTVLYRGQVPITSQLSSMGWTWELILMTTAMSSILMSSRTMQEMRIVQTGALSSTQQFSARAKSVASKMLLTNTLRC